MENFSAFSQFLCAISPFTNVCGCRRSMDHSLRTAFHSSLYLCAFTHLSACDKSPQHECLTQHSWALYQLPRAWSADTSCLLLRRSRGSCEESHAHLEDQLGKNVFRNPLRNLEKFIPEVQLLLTHVLPLYNVPAS